MQYDGDEELLPQEEEGITNVRVGKARRYSVQDVKYLWLYYRCDRSF